MEINQKVLAGSDVEVEGVVCLELTDPHTGRVLERVESRNAISEWWQLRSRRDARSHFYGGNPNQTGFDRPMSTGLGHVYLSTSDNSLGEPLIDGTLTGWADKTAYSGASTKRGSIIAAECLSAPEFTRYVWEWATTAANGYVRSVGLCEAALPDTEQCMWGGPPRTWGPLFQPQAKYVWTQQSYYDASAQMLWMCDASAIYGYPVTVGPYDMKEVVDYIPSPATRSVARAAAGFPSNSLSDVTGDGTNLYVAANTSTIKKFAYPTGLSADPSESTISVSGRTAMVRVAHDGSYLWVSEGANVYRVNSTSGAIERSFPIIGAPTGMWWYTERNLLLISYNNHLYAYDLDGNRVMAAYGPYNSLSTTNSGYLYTYMTDHTLWCFGSLYYSGSWQQCEALGSLRNGTRTVLSSEIEKTNLTGMKLTYTFNFS